MLVENGRQVKSSKQLVIKGFKSRPKLPEDFEKQTWEKLKAAVLAVQVAQPVATSLEELYQAVESMCFHKLSESLYKNLEDVCNRHTRDSLQELAGQLGKGSAAFLQHMSDCWAQHCQKMLLIRSIFLYLDRSYVLPKADLHVRSIFDLGLQQFRSHLEQHPEMVRTVVQGVLDLFRGDRGRDAVDRSLLLAMVTMLRDLGMYAAVFLQPFLQDTRALYAAEGTELSASLPPPDYLRHCEARLAEEAARARDFLEAASAAPLVRVVEEQLLSRHLAAVLDRGFGALVDEHRTADLSRLYKLAGRVDAVVQVRAHFANWIKAAGAALVSDPEKDSSMVEGLLQLKANLDELLAASFNNDADFARVLRDAFEKLINQRENKPAELIAKYLDAKLKAGNKSASDSELEEEFDRVLVLFRYIQGKDVFEAFYKKDFAKRLLMQKFASIDVEKAVIAKLKAECGSQYTSKLEGMLKDEALSRDILVMFRGSPEHQEQLPSGLDMNVRVLTSGFWPTYPAMDAKLPEELNRCKSVFETFYLSKHSGRRLTWFNSLETCTLRAYFPASKSVKELQVSLHQALVLLLFNARDSLSFSEVLEATGLPDKEARRTLQSLACGKVRVLSKEPKGRDVNDNDAFHFNGAFQHSLYKIKINQIQMKETQEENKKTNEQVMQDRQHQIDAAVVRTMKARKSLSHKLLVNEVILQLKFNIKSSDLKKRIESLIEREYLARDSDNRDVYNYLA